MESREFQRMLMDHADRVRATIAKRIPVELAAAISKDDIWQEVCIAAYHNADKFRSHEPESLESWLSVTARNKLSDAIRHQRRRKRGGDYRIVHPGDYQSSMVDLFAHIVGAGKSPSRTLSDKEIIRALTRAMGDLPEEERTAIHLKHIAGRSRSEIAHVMGKAESEVKRLLNRGLGRLRTRLGDAYRFLSDDRSTDPNHKT